MGLSRRQFTQEFEVAAVRRLEQGVSIAEVARKLEVDPNVLHRWRREGPGNAFPSNGKPRWSEGRIAELDRKIGQQTVEIHFRSLLATHRGTADANIKWKSPVYREVQEEISAGQELTIERMVELGGGEPVRLLPLLSSRNSKRGWTGHGTAGCNSTHR